MSEVNLNLPLYILISTTLFALIAFIARRFIENKLKNYFDQLIENVRHEHEVQVLNLQTRLDSALSNMKQWSSEKFDAFKEASSLGYRCRNLARDLCEEEKVRNSRAVMSEFSSLVDDYDNCLTNRRLVLYGETWETLHILKRQLRRYRNLVEVEVGEGDSNERILIDKYREIDTTWLTAINLIQQDFGENCTVAWGLEQAKIDS